MVVIPESHTQVQDEDTPQQAQKRINQLANPVNDQYWYGNHRIGDNPAQTPVMRRSRIAPGSDMCTSRAQQGQKKIICTHWPEVVNEQCTKNREKKHGNPEKADLSIHYPSRSLESNLTIFPALENRIGKPVGASQYRHSNARFA